jgi:hypothetical protein
MRVGFRMTSRANGRDWAGGSPAVGRPIGPPQSMTARCYPSQRGRLLNDERRDAQRPQHIPTPPDCSRNRLCGERSYTVFISAMNLAGEIRLYCKRLQGNGVAQLLTARRPIPDEASSRTMVLGSIKAVTHGHKKPSWGNCCWCLRLTQCHLWGDCLYKVGTSTSHTPKSSNEGYWDRYICV